MTEKKKTTQTNKGKKTDKETESQPRIRIKIKSYDYRIIDDVLKSILEAVQRSGAKVIGPVFLPTEKKKYTVLKSTFVHKDAREQFEIRIHKRLIDIVNISPKTVETLTGLNLPAGVDVEIKM